LFLFIITAFTMRVSAIIMIVIGFFITISLIDSSAYLRRKEVNCYDCYNYYDYNYCNYDCYYNYILSEIINTIIEIILIIIAGIIIAIMVTDYI
jgi:hypothetical protein